MSFSRKILIIVILLILVVAGLFLLNYQPGEAPTDVNPITEIEIDPVNQAQVIEANNQFAFDLYALYREKPGNIFFSPYSISTALAMTYEGARGETAQEMAEVFHFPTDNEVRWNGFAGFHNLLNQPGREYILSAANALWPAKEYPFLEEYFETISRYYRGGSEPLDFQNQPEESRLIINSWVEDETRGKIKDLIPAEFVTPSIKLILTNAVYFKGDWLDQFDPSLTQDEDFYLENSGSISVPIMKQFGRVADYAEVDGVQILSLPYKGEELSMMILLPAAGEIDRLEESLTLEKINDYREAVYSQEIDLFLPKFKLETKYFMKDDLIAMGMPSAFDGTRADFSGMTGAKDLFVSTVIHQAFVEVNEEGTEAAAATGVMMQESALLEKPVFRADHPFVFVIQHQETGAILFMGRVGNPS